MNQFDIKAEFQSLKSIIKNLLIVLAVYLVIKGLLILYIHYEERKPIPLPSQGVQPATNTHVSGRGNSQLGTKESNVGASNVTASALNTDNQTGTLAPAEAREVSEWLTLKGYLSLDQRRYYESYDEKTLVALANNGDLAAIQGLIDKYIKMPNVPLDKVLFYLNEAAIRGSTTAIEGLAIFSSGDYDHADTTEEKQNAAIENLALRKTMALRGDQMLSDSATKSYIKQVTQMYDSNFRVTPELQIKIDQRAQEIYADFQSKRRDRGLGDFDNSVLDSVKKAFNLKN